MLEISPVLAGTFDAPNYVPPNNFASSPTENANGVDARRYTQFDRTATEAGSTTDFSFSDLVDLVNPLQHIPVVSSVYREITGDKINPVSRVVGDILYGGLLGGATAALSGMSAIGDSVMEASTGKDATGVVVAALFGPDDKKSATGDTQLASATPAATPDATAAAAAAAPAALASAAPLPAPPPAAPSPPPPSAMPAFAQLAKAMPANAMPANADAQTQALLAAKAFPLDPKKLAFGGVMDPGALQGSNMALSLATSAPGMQMGQTVYPGRLINSVRPLSASASPPPAASAASTVASSNNPPLPSDKSALTITVPPAQAASDPIALPPGIAQNTPLPADLMQDIASLRAVNQYKNTASQSTPVGSKVDLVN